MLYKHHLIQPPSDKGTHDKWVGRTLGIDMKAAYISTKAKVMGVMGTSVTSNSELCTQNLLALKS